MDRERGLLGRGHCPLVLFLSFKSWSISSLIMQIIMITIYDMV